MLLGSIFEGQNLSSVFCAPRLSVPDAPGSLTAFSFKHGIGAKALEIDVVIVLNGCAHVATVELHS